MRPPALACLLPLLVLPAPAAAQAVPALEPAPARTGPPPPVSLLSGREAALSAKERHGVALAGRWMAGAGTPARGADGAVVFAYGATLPSVVCAPLRACSLRLEPGETIAQIDLGDPVHWKVTPTVFGSGAAATSAVVVKPSDSGLTTSMTVATDRRLYVVQLVSRTKDWMPVVAFAYPEDERAAWEAYRAARGREAEAADGLGGLDPAALDFGFRVSGDRPSWRPLRVYTDGVRTYVQFPPAMRHDEAPALVAIGSDAREQLVNYRLTGDRFVVDTVLRHAALVSGVGGDQVKVEIRRNGAAK